MKSKKSIVLVAVLLIVLCIGGFLYAKRSNPQKGDQPKNIQMPKIETKAPITPVDNFRIQDFSVSADKSGELEWTSSLEARSGSNVHFRFSVIDADSCSISGGNLFDAKTVFGTSETDIKKKTNDFSGGTYALNCLRKSDSKTVSKSITLNIVPLNKLVMCMKKCGSGGTPVEQNMTRYLGESVQGVRACFGSYSSKCPSQDVTTKANWTSSNPQVAIWTKDLKYPQETFDDVYRNKAFLTSQSGSAAMKVEYNGYSYSVNVIGKQVGQ